MTIQDSSAITGNTSIGVGADVDNPGVLYLDSSSSAIGLFDGNSSIPI